MPAAGDRGGDPAAPSKLWLLVELRAAAELAATLATWRRLRRLPRGDGHPVLVLPGFLASDLSTRPLRRFLRELGYRAHRWKLGRNLGLRHDLEERLRARFEAVHADAGRRVSLIGWSLGGVHARALANRQPARVRSLVTLGAPITGDPKANNSWRIYQWITGQRLDEIPPERLDEVRRTPPVPTTSILSPTDGVVAWQTSLQPEGPASESVVVPGSHLGLGFNRRVLAVIADRLAQPEGAWQPYFRPGCDPPPRVRPPAGGRTHQPETDRGRR